MCLQYAGEGDLTYVMGLIDNELSEPYSIFTYRRANIDKSLDCFLTSDSPGLLNHRLARAVLPKHCSCLPGIFCIPGLACAS